MEIADHLLKNFAVLTSIRNEYNRQQTYYATAVIDNNKLYVRIDGSEELTAVATTTEVNDGDRVMVMISNHTAVITGKLIAQAELEENES